MNNIKYISVVIFLISTPLLLSQNSSEKIQENINKKNQELDSISDEIKKITTQISKKQSEVRYKENQLTEIAEKIKLTYNLIELIKNEKLDFVKSILETEQKIKSNETELEKLKNKYSKLVKYLYKNKNHSYIEIMLTSKSWKQVTYKLKYLDALSKEKNQIDIKMQNILKILDKEILLLKNKVLEKEKERLTNKSSIIKLTKKQNKEKEILSETNSAKFNLEKERFKKKEDFEKINKLIIELLANKEAALKREIELRKIRKQKEREDSIIYSSNFVNLKGKLPWPAKGNIISKYGPSSNQYGIKKFNSGIEIKTNINSNVISIFDGIVADIGYTPLYGSYIIIDHGNKYSTFYGNIDENNIKVSKSDYVNYNQPIGTTLNDNDEEYGILNFMIFETQNDNDGTPVITNKNPEEWIK